MTANKLKRYILFFIGVFINSFGISVITKADLGTSPISSVPYVLSLNFSLQPRRIYHRREYAHGACAARHSPAQF